VPAIQGETQLEKVCGNFKLEFMDFFSSFMRKSQFRMRHPLLAQGESARFTIPLVSRMNFNPVWKHKRTVRCTDWGEIGIGPQTEK
jgi:hypothetical protein